MHNKLYILENDTLNIIKNKVDYHWNVSINMNFISARVEIYIAVVLFCSLSILSKVELHHTIL